jgi:hypothetical protein
MRDDRPIARESWRGHDSTGMPKAIAFLSSQTVVNQAEPCSAWTRTVATGGPPGANGSGVAKARASCAQKSQSPGTTPAHCGLQTLQKTQAKRFV